MSNPPQPANPANAKPPKPYIETRSAHNVRLWMRQAIVEGRLRDCSNLALGIVRPQKAGVDAGDSYFVPSCKHHSLESTFVGVEDRMQLQILRHSLSTDPVSCPKNCTFYENLRIGRAKFQVRRICDVLRSLWKGYAALAWQTQVTIIVVPALLLILWKSPTWVPLIISLARAIWGKTP